MVIINPKSQSRQMLEKRKALSLQGRYYKRSPVMQQTRTKKHARDMI